MKNARLSDLVGQEPAVRLFRRALEGNRLAQTYLLVGPEGTGKETSVRALVREIFCENGEGCDGCRSCQKLARGVHPDFLVLQAQGDSIRIAQVRAAEEFLRFRPLEAPVRVVLVPEAERLTPEAANALLKSLEEPPPYAHFFLTAVSAEALLPTIVSRSQVVRFRPLPPALIERVLRERFGKPPEEARALALLAEGSLGRALSLAEKGLLEELNRLVGVSRNPDPALKLRAAEMLAQRREDLSELFYLIRIWLWYSFLRARGLCEFPEVFPEPAPAERALALLDLAERLRQGLDYRLNPELTLLVFILRLSEAFSRGP